jgi:ABC-type lipoprotein export system ATPase subunit
MKEAVKEDVGDDQRRLCELPVIRKRKLEKIVRARHFPFNLSLSQARRASLDRELTRKPSIIMYLDRFSLSRIDRTKVSNEHPMG